MKIAVRYQSRNGNTKAVAQRIAKLEHVNAESIDVGLTEYVDVLFVGGGVYMWKMDEHLRDYMEKLDANQIGQIVCFSTTGTMESTNKQLREIATKKKIRVNEQDLLLRMLTQGHSALGLKGGNLTEKQVQKIEEFVKKLKFE